MEKIAKFVNSKEKNMCEYCFNHNSCDLRCRIYNNDMRTTTWIDYFNFFDDEKCF